MELRQLEYFVAVAEAGSFTEAVRRVHVVQSGLSTAVKKLERELGVSLFDRSRRRIALTDAGAALLVEARRVLSAVRVAHESVGHVADGEAGTVRAGIMHSLVGPRVVDALATFHSEHPGVRLAPRTDPGGSGGLVRAVADDELDLALAGVAGDPHEGVVTYRLSEERMGLLCPPGDPLAGRDVVALEELHDRSFVDVPPGWGSRTAFERTLAEHGISRHVDVEVGDVATVTDLVRAGFGLAVLAPSSFERGADLCLQRLEPAPMFVVSLVLPRQRSLGPAARLLADALLRTSSVQ